MAIIAFRVTLTNRSFLAFVGANLMISFIWSWLSAMVPADVIAPR